MDFSFHKRSLFVMHPCITYVLIMNALTLNSQNNHIIILNVICFLIFFILDLINRFYFYSSTLTNGIAMKQCSYVSINMTKPWFQYYIFLHSEWFLFLFFVVSVYFRCRIQCNWIFRLIFVFHIVHFDVTTWLISQNCYPMWNRNDHCKPPVDAKQKYNNIKTRKRISKLCLLV